MGSLAGGTRDDWADFLSVASPSTSEPPVRTMFVWSKNYQDKGLFRTYVGKSTSFPEAVATYNDRVSALIGHYKIVERVINGDWHDGDGMEGDSASR